MGCHASKLENADDSIHVILAHATQDKAKHGGTSYVPRKQHPLLVREGPPTAVEEASDADSQNDLDRLLYHAAHHNDTIDPRDLEEYGQVDPKQ